jgi:hypothetical protein
MTPTHRLPGATFAVLCLITASLALGFSHGRSTAPTCPPAPLAR